MPLTKAEQVERFMHLFRGSPRSYGQWKPATGKMFTEVGRAGSAQFKAHLSGRVGLGIAPIMEDGLTCWGCIDVDTPEGTPTGEQPNLAELEKTIRELELPLIVCRSKSGDAHLFMFLKDPTPAYQVRNALSNWAQQLGYPGIEIFPKQNELTEHDAKGSWLNLPYFKASSSERYAVIGGKRASLELFIETATALAAAQHFFKVIDREHAEAPPCIQAMLAGKIQPGQRNKALYNITVYLKKKSPNSYESEAFNANANFERPLEHGEAKTTIKSAAKRDYRYQCKEDPCKALCDSYTCVKRKYGITPSEQTELVREMPMFGALRKLLSDPVYWKLAVNGQDITVSTPVLLNFEKLREAIADAQTILVPGMPKPEWETFIAKEMESAQVLEIPDDASTSGIIRSRLREFIRKADDTALDMESRRNITHGVPVVQEIGGQKLVLFRGSDFVDHLKRQRGEELKGVNLWFALSKLGVSHHRLRIPGIKEPIEVWALEHTAIADPLPVPELEPEY